MEHTVLSITATNFAISNVSCFRTIVSRRMTQYCVIEDLKPIYSEAFTSESLESIEDIIHSYR